MNAEALKNFLIVPKPDWCTGLDVAVVAHLIVIADEGGYSSPLQSELAEATGASMINYKGLRASLNRLHENYWITWYKGVKGVPGERHRYKVNFENLIPGKKGDEFTLKIVNHGEEEP